MTPKLQRKAWGIVYRQRYLADEIWDEEISSLLVAHDCLGSKPTRALLFLTRAEARQWINRLRGWNKREDAKSLRVVRVTETVRVVR